ncbi:LysR family transcriptional regulator [Agaribacterium sp. ZY112]|uniref:LysR family transcriptional regulator n=1 Tax=Agaribacterium sp. ZY112 TaxID=3233574 RepID=UPI003525591C
MNIDQIKTFIAVYRSGSFAAVAQSMDVATSSVSRTIANLEEKLQVRLFQRSTRQLSATEAGEQYFQKVEALVEELDRVHHELNTESSEPSGRLRVTASVSFGQKRIAPLLNSFHASYPKVDIELHLSDSRVDLIEDQFDVAIRHGQLEDSSFIAKKLLDVRYLLVASPNYLRAHPALLSPSDISQHTQVSFPCVKFSKEWLFRKDGKTQAVSIDPALTVSTALVIKECVKGSMGIAVLADWTVKEELNNGELMQLLPEWQVAGSNFDSSIWLIYPSRSFVPAKTAAFCAYLLKHISTNSAYG